MNRLGIALIGLLFVAAAAAEEPDSPERVERYGDMVSVFSGDILVPAGTLQRGTIVCIGGEARIEGEVEGDVVVILGRLENLGRIRGAVTGVLSDQHHRDAEIRGAVVEVLGTLDLQNTRVTSELVNILGTFARDSTSSAPSVNIGFGSWLPNLGFVLLWLRLLRLFGAFVVLLLLAALVPERLRVIAEEAPLRYATAFFVGLLGHLGLLVVVALLGVTLIGLPFAMLIWVVFKWLGIAGVFLAVGRRLGRALGREMSLLGALMLSFGLYALVCLAPSPLGLPGLALSILWAAVFLFVIQVPAVGLVFLTLAGGRSGRAPRGAASDIPGPAS